MEKLKLISTILLTAIFAFQCSDNDTPVIDTNQVAYDAADVINGGRMYDKFWASETNFISPNDPIVDMVNISNFPDFYRCKSCHGWDQKGNAASYINRGSKTTRPDVSSVDLTLVKDHSIADIFDEVKHSNGAEVDVARTADGTNVALGGNNMPNYGKLLTDAQVWDLVKFIKEGALDTDQLYDVVTTGTYPTGTRIFTNVGKNGDAALGKVFYDNNCASCHGSNGRDNNGTIVSINANIGLSMGQFAREKTYEIQHKSRYGTLGSSMAGTPTATVDDIKNMLKALADPTKYPDL